MYESKGIIGQGSFGTIRKVKRRSDGLILAQKELCFRKMSKQERTQIVAEVTILQNIRHANIVLYHEKYVDRDAGILYILMEFCSGGDLSAVIKKARESNEYLPEETIWLWFLQLLLALQYCHEPKHDGNNAIQQILHRDLKPDNGQVFLDETRRVKLGDFNLAKALSEEGPSFTQTILGTPYYMSPELMQEKPYDSKSDIWSLGCLIYELCALKSPFHSTKTFTELRSRILNGKLPCIPKQYSKSLTSLVKAMLHIDPGQRPSATQLLQEECLQMTLRLEGRLTTVLTKELGLLDREVSISAKEKGLAMAAARNEELLIATARELEMDMRKQMESEKLELETEVRKSLELKLQGELMQVIVGVTKRVTILTEKAGQAAIPHEEICDMFAPLAQMIQSSQIKSRITTDYDSTDSGFVAVQDGPSHSQLPLSPMRGVILTATQEALATPTSDQFVQNRVGRPR